MSVSAATSLSAKSGPKTAGPRIAPKTGPEEDERDPARPALGRVHVAGGGADEQRHRPGRPDEDEADDHEHRRIPVCARGGQQCSRAEPSRKPVGDHGHPAEAIHRPSGRECGERGRGQVDRGPGADQALKPVTSTKVRVRRQRRAGGPPSYTARPPREERRVAPDRELLRQVAPTPHGTRGRRAMDGGFLRSRARLRDSTDRHDRPAESELVEEGARARDLLGSRPAIRRGSAGADASGRRSRAGRRPRPRAPRARGGRSSQSPRRPAPVSCRSEVNGRPLTRAPR